jgi:hypothetical protein
MIAHYAKHKGAIGRPDCRRGEAIDYPGVRAPPALPFD